MLGSFEISCFTHLWRVFRITNILRLSAADKTARDGSLALAKNIVHSPHSHSPIIEITASCLNYIFLSEESGIRPRTATQGIPWMSHSATLLWTDDGELHLYCDEEHAKIISSDLPVGQPLWGAVDVVGNCIQIKSEILDQGNASNINNSAGT